MAESAYQIKLIKKLRDRFPDGIILKNDAGYLQGVPDLTVFVGDRWATLEVKDHVNANERPNQRYYVERMSEMSFSAFIYPENEEEVFNALQHALRPRRKTRIPKPQ